MMEGIKTEVRQIESFDVHITGLTRSEVYELIEGLNFVNERLPGGLRPVVVNLLNDLRTITERGPITEEHFRSERA